MRWLFYELGKFGHLTKDTIKQVFELQGGGFIIGFVLGALLFHWMLLLCLVLVLLVISLFNSMKG
jgi:diacylglycerol kinase